MKLLLSIDSFASCAIVNSFFSFILVQIIQMEERVAQLETEAIQMKKIIMDLLKNQQELAMQMTEFVKIYSSNLNENSKNSNPIIKKETKNIRQMLKRL